MSHIQVDLKVIEVKAPGIARATGIAEEVIGWGLVRLWHSCWSLRREYVAPADIAGAFGHEAANRPELIEALSVYEILDHEGPRGFFRVRGADKYLRVLAGRSKGGKAASANLKRGKTKGSAGAAAGKQPESTRKEASGSPPADQRLLPGLSPSTEHRTPNTEKISAAPPRATNPRHAPMVEKLGAVYFEVFGAKYDFGDKRDFAAIVELLKKTEDDDEIVARFAFALVKSKDKFHTPKTRTIAQLARDWNCYPVEKRQEATSGELAEVEKIREAMRRDAAETPGVWG